VITWFQNRRAKLKRDVEELKADMKAAKALGTEPAPNAAILLSSLDELLLKGSRSGSGGTAGKKKKDGTSAAAAAAALSPRAAGCSGAGADSSVSSSSTAGDGQVPAAVSSPGGATDSRTGHVITRTDNSGSGALSPASDTHDTPRPANHDSTADHH